MPRSIPATLAALVLLVSPGPAAADELADRLAELTAAHPETMSTVEIGRSVGDRPIALVRIARPGPIAPDERPALLIVAGLDGRHALGTRIALATIEHLLTTDDEATIEALGRRTVLVVPRASPDAAAAGAATNDRPIDHDRDGRRGEDPPSDLDGDGHVVAMRVPDPEGEWIVDPDEPRLLRKADPARGEGGRFRLLPEGSDTDGDGEIAEDGDRGVEVDRNFPHRYEMHRDASGRHAASEPEARALLDLLVLRRNVAAVLCYGLDDNLLATPEAGETKPRQAATKIDPADHALFEEVGEAYREMTATRGKARPTPGGTFFEWAYFQWGLPSFSARGWYEPAADPPDDQGKQDEKKNEKPDEKKNEKKKKDESDDARRLALADRLGRGFVEWTAFDHPSLGPVEIGGLVDGFEFAPPEDEAAAAAAAHAPFAAHVLGLLPDVRLVDVRATRLADGLFRVEASVVNEGRMPLATAQGRRARRPGPVVVRLGGRFTLRGGRPEGQPQYVVWDLPGGGRTAFEWIVQDPEDLVVELTSRRGFAGREEVDCK